MKVLFPHRQGSPWGLLPSGLVKRNKPLVGVTGIIGSGKTTVSEIFGQLGASVFSADEAAREVTGEADVIQTIADTFGQEMLRTDGSVDRKRLADLVFNDPVKLQRLNGIIHPLVRRQMWNLVDEQQRRAGVALIIIDSPLIYETDLHTSLDFVVVVLADEEKCIQRVMNRDGLSRDEILERLSRQIPLSKKKERADFCIDNDGNEESLIDQVEEVFNKIQKKWASR